MLTSVLRTKVVGAARTAPGRCAVGAHAVAVRAARGLPGRTLRKPAARQGGRSLTLTTLARPARLRPAGNRHFLVSPGATEIAPTAQRPGASISTNFELGRITRLAAHCLVVQRLHRAGEGVPLLFLSFIKQSSCSGSGARGGWARGAISVAPGETRAERGIRNAQRCARAAGSPCKANRGMGGLPSGGTQAGRAGIARAASGHPCEPVASEGFAREVRAQRGPKRHERPGPSLRAPRRSSATPTTTQHP